MMCIRFLCVSARHFIAGAAATRSNGNGRPQDLVSATPAPQIWLQIGISDTKPQPPERLLLPFNCCETLTVGLGDGDEAVEGLLAGGVLLEAHAAPLELPAEVCAAQAEVKPCGRNWA